MKPQTKPSFDQCTAFEFLDMGFCVTCEDWDQAEEFVKRTPGGFNFYSYSCLIFGGQKRLEMARDLNKKNSGFKLFFWLN